MLDVFLLLLVGECLAWYLLFKKLSITKPALQYLDRLPSWLLFYSASRCGPGLSLIELGSKCIVHMV